MYGRTTTSAMPNRTVMATRRSRRRRGADHLIQHASAELRLEGVPSRYLRERGRAEAIEHTCVGVAVREHRERLLPRGVLTSCTGSAARSGPRSWSHRDVDLVSFTGSAETGRWINEHAGRRLARSSRARRPERAIVRLRRRRSRPRRRVVACVGVSNARPALRGRQQDRRLRRRLRRVPRRGSSPARARTTQVPVISEESLQRIWRRSRARPSSRAGCGLTAQAGGWSRRSWRASPPTPSCPAASCSGR